MKKPPMLETLFNRFPDAFNEQHRPLVIGIAKTLEESLAIGADDAAGRTELLTALRFYATNRKYLRNVAVGAERIDLQGQASSKPTEGHRTHARGLLAAIERKDKAKYQPERQRAQNTLRKTDQSTISADLKPGQSTIKAELKPGQSTIKVELKPMGAREALRKAGAFVRPTSNG